MALGTGAFFAGLRLAMARRRGRNDASRQGGGSRADCQHGHECAEEEASGGDHGGSSDFVIHQFY